MSLSKFDTLCNLIIERADASIADAKPVTVYKLNPEYNSAELTGVDRLVANFVEDVPATANDIIDVIVRNSDDTEDITSAKELFSNLLDANVITVATDDTSTEDEPSDSEISSTDDVDVNDPIVIPPESSDEDDEDEDEGSSVPPPEEDESDTFDANSTKSRVEDISPEAETISDEEEDDIPTSELISKASKKRDQMVKLIKHIYSKRGKSPEEAQAHIDRLISQNKI